jgi:hypothetical protein
VTSPAVAAEEKREEEEAYESVHNFAMYRPSDRRLPPALPLGLIVLVAALGAGLSRGAQSRRQRRRPAYARAERQPRR